MIRRCRLAPRAAVWTATACLAASAGAKPHPRKRPPPTAVAPSTPEPLRHDSPSDTIDVVVVEVAGNQAYLSPGTKGGVRRGATVRFGRKEYQVVQATDSFAAIVVGDDAPRPKDEGVAARVDETATKVVELEKPKPLATWEHAWVAAAPPADSQKPRFVPLGEAEGERRWDVRLSASTGALLPLGTRGSNLVRAELDARVHAEPFEAPLAFDLDLGVERYFDPNLSTRAGSESRPTLFVRELLASYASAGFYGALGRMRYAASTLGTLDGARVGAPLGGGFSLGAFGGLLPNPLSGAPSLAGNRFGVEATYSRPDLDLRPDAALVVHGSTFGGKLDERRLSGVVSVYPGPSRFSGHFQVSGFDSTNPWKASSVELTEAGFDSSVRAGVFELGGRFDARQPERSRWLASYLPASWFCATVPAAGSPATEPCDGRVATRAYGTVDAGMQLDRVSFFVGGTMLGDLTQSDAPSSIGAFASGRVIRIARIFRVEASGSYSRSTYIDMFGGGGGPGFTLFEDALDVSVYYRATSLRYRSVSATLLQHATGGAVILMPDPTLLIAVEGEAIAGGDTDALMLFGSATWRPRL